MARVKPSLVRLVSCLALVGAVCSPPTAAPTRASEQATVPGILPSGLGEAIDRDIEKARSATARYKVASDAITAGYEATTSCVQHPQHGVMGLHYKKTELHDATVDVRNPEILLYEPRPHGRAKLNGVEYIVPIASWTRSEPPTVMQQPMIRDEKLGIWYLHVWIWEANPSGLFANWNPRVKC